MKYSNIINEFNRPEHKNVKNILINAGYNQIGHGCHAEVYTKPGKDFVLKIVSNSDKAYYDFYKFCMVNHSQHLPKFRGKFMKINDNYSAIRMELLIPLPLNDAQIQKDIYCMAMISRFYNGEHNIIPPDVKEWASQHESIFDILQKIGTSLSKHCDDICLYNVMKRDDVYVFIDPVG